MTTLRSIHPVFQHEIYTFRRKVFRFFGGAFTVYDEDGQLLLRSEQKSFQLKEDFRIYSADSNEELLVIKTPQILDIGAIYHVTDTTTGESVGAIRRKAIKSIFKDEWVIVNTRGQEIGKLVERSSFGAFMSRMLDLIPQEYSIVTEAGFEVAQIQQHFNPFVLRYTMVITNEDIEFDRRILLATGILLAGIETRQK